MIAYSFSITVLYVITFRSNLDVGTVGNFLRIPYGSVRKLHTLHEVAACSGIITVCILDCEIIIITITYYKVISVTFHHHIRGLNACSKHDSVILIRKVILIVINSIRSIADVKAIFIHSNTSVHIVISGSSNQSVITVLSVQCIVSFFTINGIISFSGIDCIVTAKHMEGFALVITYCFAVAVLGVIIICSNLNVSAVGNLFRIPYGSIRKLHTFHKVTSCSRIITVRILDCEIVIITITYYKVISVTFHHYIRGLNACTKHNSVVLICKTVFIVINSVCSVADIEVVLILSC